MINYFPHLQAVILGLGRVILDPSPRGKLWSFIAGLRRGSKAAAKAGSKASKAKGSEPLKGSHTFREMNLSCFWVKNKNLCKEEKWKKCERKLKHSVIISIQSRFNDQIQPFTRASVAEQAAERTSTCRSSRVEDCRGLLISLHQAVLHFGQSSDQSTQQQWRTAATNTESLKLM